MPNAVRVVLGVLLGVLSATGQDSVLLVFKHSQKCLDVYDKSLHRGADVHQWACTGKSQQQWYLEPFNGYTRMKSVNSGLCIDVPRASMDVGVVVEQHGCHTGSNQMLTYENKRFRFQHSNMCLEVSGDSNGDGAKVVQMPCDTKKDSQVFERIAVTPAPLATPVPTSVPLTPVPTTPIPSTATPPTAVPETPVPSTAVPPTPVPSTASPPTAVPATPLPSTAAPPTPVPSTASPPTAVPATPIPSTAVPATPIPSTAVPPTPVPSTATLPIAVPATPLPSTATPPTAVPAIPIPSTAPQTAVPAPPISSTAAPPTSVLSTTAPASPVPSTAVVATPVPMKKTRALTPQVNGATATSTASMSLPPVHPIEEHPAAEVDSDTGFPKYLFWGLIALVALCFVLACVVLYLRRRKASAEETSELNNVLITEFKMDSLPPSSSSASDSELAVAIATTATSASASHSKLFV